MDAFTATIDGQVFTVRQIIPDGGKIYLVVEDSNNHLFVIEKAKNFEGHNGIKGRTHIASNVT